MEKQKRRASPELVCVEVAQLPLEGVLAARGLFRAFTKASKQSRQPEATSVTSRDEQLSSPPPSVDVHVMVVNVSNEEIELPRTTVLGITEETSANIIAVINDEETLNSRHSDRTRCGVIRW